MKKGRLYDRHEIELISKSAIGKTVNDIINEEVVSFERNKDANKGEIGQLIERFLFGIDNNNDSDPDFMPAGVELKVTPYKKLKNGKLSAKERLSLNIIDYMSEYKNDFKSSHFWFKNNTIQLLWYLWEPNKDSKELKITHEKLLELAKSEDLKQIEEDWNLIINKIKTGKAHEISEADTMYLGASPKGASSSSVRKQPFSNIPAMQRSFCLKNSYMTQLVRKYIGDYSDVERILKNNDLLFDDYVKSVTEKYKGKTIDELKALFNITSNNPKDINYIVISRMFGVKGRLSESEEFKKANIVPKTVTINSDKSIKESMSFPAFKFSEIIKEDWYNSELRELFETTKFLFCIFKIINKKKVFVGIKMWNMPETIIDNEVRKCWEDTVYKIKYGVKLVVNSNNIVSNDLLGAKDNAYVHVRPHTSKSAYKLRNGFTKGNIKAHADLLPQGDYMTKQCFWINKSFLENILIEYM